MSPNRTTPLVVPTNGRPILRRVVAAMSHPAGVEVGVAALLAHTRPAYGGRTWAGALPALMSDAAYARIVHDLVAELNAGRPMAEPVWVHARRGHPVRNGMHRITAHVLAGHRTIRATTAVSAEPVEMIELTGTLSPTPGAKVDPALAAEVAQDGDLAVLMRLRSLPVGPVWASSDSAGTHGDEWNAWYYVPHAHQGGLVAAVTSRAHELGFDLRITKVDLVSSAD